MKPLFRALIPVSMLLAVGCSGGEEPQEPADAGSAAPAADAAPAAEPAPVANTAEAAVQSVIDGIGSGKAGAVWEALPPRYQSDINEVVQSFGNTMDPNIWGQIRGAIEKIHTVLSTKSEFLVNSPALQGAEDPEQVKKSLPQIASLLKIVLDMSELEALKSFDGQKFFDGPASSLIMQADAISQLAPGGFSMTSQMQNVKVETVSSEGDTAVLKITNPDDPSQDREETFQKVDDHWVPAEMAQDWDTQIQMAHTQIEAMPQMLQEQAFMITAITSSITAGLDPLVAAEDQEQFDTALMQLQAGLGGMMGPMFGGMAPPGGDPGSSPGDFGDTPDSPPEAAPEPEPEAEPAEEPAAAE